MKNKYGAVVFQCFTHEQVKEINEEIRKNLEKEQKPEASAQNVNKIGKFSYISCQPLMKMIHPWLSMCQQINRNCFGYDIYWNFHFESLNYNVYEENGEYGWHIDGIKDGIARDSKLTCLLNLSEEPYEGGEFYMTNVEDEIKFTSGE